MDVWWKKWGQGVESWKCVDRFGNSHIMEVDKFTMMHRCDLPACDLRLLDTSLDYPSTILTRDKAIVVNLEHIQWIITADEVLILNSHDPEVLEVVEVLQRRLATAGLSECAESNRRRSMINRDNISAGIISPDYFPFEFKALEAALEGACASLNSRAIELERDGYPLLDEIASQTSKLNLESMRQMKRRLLALTQRVEKVRDAIERLMHGDADVAEMLLSEKNRPVESSFREDQSLMEHRATESLQSAVSISLSPVTNYSPPHSHELKKCSSIKSVELEMFLEAYFVVSESTINKLRVLKEYINDTEDLINIQLDNVRNQLIQYELVLSTASFVASIFGVVAGVFGMNFPIPLYNEHSAFMWVLIITGISGVIIFCAFVWFFKYRKLMRLMWS